MRQLQWARALDLVLGFLLLVPLLACADLSARQRFYMAAVSFSGIESAAIAYLKTPYGEQADEAVLVGLQEGIEEGAATLTRIRPLLPPAGEEPTDINRKLLEAGLDTMDSIVQRLDRVVFSPEFYQKE